MTLRIAIRTTERIPIDFAGVTPESIAERTLDEVRRMPIRRGNRSVELGELFALAGDPRQQHWELEGDFSAVHGVGFQMASGEIVVRGNVGRHAGAQMHGGRIEVHGDAGDCLGGEMRGGVVRVRDNAGGKVGAAYPGSARGMSGGTILVDGDVGNELGAGMRRGLIAVGGSAGDHVGLQMLAGSIFVFGQCGAYPGLGMRRGTIGLFGGDRPALLPTFSAGYRGPMPALHLIEKHLHSLGFNPPRLRMLAGVVELAHGDQLELGRGEVVLPV
jgi:formylmethanofuran dehydrogenase subunit C